MNRVKAAFFATLAATALPNAASALDAAACVAKYQAVVGATLTEAKVFTAPVPYCRLDGYVTTTNPGPNKVRFMLAMPETWNGRYLFTVQGGAAGWVPDPTEEHLKLGYAIASTDKGVTTSGGLDFSFNANPAMALDWAHRGVHVVAQATQKMVRDHYGAAKLNRYVMGCSGGGDGTLVEAEMYPGDFDAYIGGAMNTDYPYGTTLTWAAIGQRMHRVPGAWISPDDYVKIHNALLAKYDARDGAVDGLIWDPRVVKLGAADRKLLSFLTDAQWGTAKLIQGGVKDAKGAVLAPGFWFGNPKMFQNFLTGRTPPPWKTMAEQPAGWTVADTGSKARAGAGFSFVTDVDFAAITSDAPGLERTKFDHRKLAALRDSGAKLILWVGAAEEAVSEQQILGYTERVAKTFGGTAKREEFLRTFVIPGLHHCGRGDNAPTNTVMAMLSAAQDWVEKGQPPTSVVLNNETFAAPASATAPAQAAAPATRTYRVCPFPQRSVFTGGVKNPKGLDLKDAANWICKG